MYTPSGGDVEVGLLGTAGFSMSFSSPFAVLDYLPAGGPICPLNSDHADPNLTTSGAFGGEVLALQLNVDFADAWFTVGTAGVAFGNLTLCNFSALLNLNGVTVRQFLAIVNTPLGGGSATYSIAQLNPVTDDLNRSFDDGAVSAFARDHLVNGGCPP